jgi:hypothetical protein
MVNPIYDCEGFAFTALAALGAAGTAAAGAAASVVVGVDFAFDI